MTHGIKVFLAVLSYGYLFSFALASQSISLNPGVASIPDSEFTWMLSPLMEIGSHRFGAGGVMGMGWYPDKGVAGGISVAYATAVSLMHDEYGFGIPGPKNTAAIAAGIGLGLGGIERRGRNSPVGPVSFFPGRAWQASFRFVPYLTDDGTSQLTCVAGFGHEVNESAWSLEYENNLPSNVDEFVDSVTSDWVDKWRTAAMTFRYLHALREFGDGSHRAGFEMGFKLWTGAREPGLRLHRDHPYDLSGWYGGEYSHGILYAAALFDSLKLYAGWDSEEIRNVIQNGWHWVMDEGYLPMLERSPRLVLGVSLGFDPFLY